MVLNYQRWTPPCGCSFEQEVDSETGEVKLLFAHSICGGHEDIAKNTSQPKTLFGKDTRKDDIIKAKHKAWADNKARNESDFDNHEHFKRIKNKVKVELLNTNPDPNTQALHEYYLEEKRKHMDLVDKFTNEKSMELLIGLECPYSLNAHKVYEQVLKENQTVEG